MQRHDIVLAALDLRDSLLVVLNSRSLVIDANPAFCRILGCQRADAVGHDLMAVLGEAADPDAAARLAAALEAGRPHAADMLVNARDGRPKWLGFDLSQVVDPATGQRHGVIIGRDITAAHRHAQEEHSTQKLLAAVFLKVDVAVIVAQASGELLAANTAFQEMFGLGPTEIQSLNLRRLALPADAERLAEALRNRFEDWLTRRMRLKMLPKSGPPMAVELALCPVDHTDQQRFRVITLRPLPSQGAAPPPDRAVDKVCALSLRDVRTALGANWSRVALRVMNVAETELKSCLRPEDLFVRSGQDSFKIWFAGDLGSANQARTEEIARDIRIRIMCEFGALMPAHVTEVGVGPEPILTADRPDGTDAPPRSHAPGRFAPPA